MVLIYQSVSFDMQLCSILKYNYAINITLQYSNYEQSIKIKYKANMFNWKYSIGYNEINPFCPIIFNMMQSRLDHR